MSKPEFDPKDQDETSMFDFLGEEGKSVGKGKVTPNTKPVAESKHPRDIIRMPEIRKPVPISESGALRAGSATIGINRSSTNVTDSDADFDFLNEVDLRVSELQKERAQSDDPYSRPKPVAHDVSIEEDMRKVHQIDPDMDDMSPIVRYGLLALSILLLGGIGYVAHTFILSPPATTIAQNAENNSVETTPTLTAEQVDDAGLAVTPDDVSNTPEVTATDDIDAIAEASNRSGLYDRFVSELSSLERIVDSGDYDVAVNRIGSMDRALYGYGEPEFLELLTRIEALRFGNTSGVNDVIKESERIASVASAEQAAKLESDRLATEQAEIAEAERLAAEQEAAAEAERLAAEQEAAAEAERLAAEQEAAKEAERLAAEQEAAAEAERLAAEQEAAAEAERLAAEQEAAAEAERLAAEQAAVAEAELVAAEQAATEEAERLAQINADRLARLAAIKAANAAAERLAAERLALVEQLNAERQAAEQAEKTESARLAAEQLAREETLQAEEASRESERLAQEAAKLKGESAVQLEVDLLSDDLVTRRQAEREAAARLAAERETAQQLAAAETARVEAERLAAEKQQAETEARQAREAEAARAAARRAARQRAERIAADQKRRQIETAATTAAIARQSTQVARAEIENLETRSSSSLSVNPLPITDGDLQQVYRRFNSLETAIESRDITEVISLTKQSGARVQQFLQIFENSQSVNAQIVNVSTSNNSATISGTLKILNITRTDGSVVQPPSSLSSIALSSSRKGGQWSVIEW